MRFILVTATLLSVLFGSADVFAKPKFWVSRIKNDTTNFPTWYSPLALPRINDRNQVILEAYPTAPRTAIWTKGMLARPSKPGDWSDMIGFGINNQGKGCGYYWDTTVHVHGFLWDSNSVSDLPPFDSAHWFFNFPRCERAWATGINDAGVVSGYASWKHDNPDQTIVIRHRPVVWVNGVIYSLGMVSGYIEDSAWYNQAPVRINNKNQVCGTFQVRYAANRGSTYSYFGSNGNLQQIPLFPNATYCVAQDISDSSHVVGWDQMQVGGTIWKHAWIYHNGSKISLHGDPGQTSIRTEAYGVNSHGEAVGAWVTNGSAQIRALYYDGDSTYDLNSLVMNFNTSGGPSIFNNLIAATDINESGAIVAIYTGPGGLSYPCLLTPYDSGVVVNSERDLPDLDPNDGKCYTGQLNSVGQEECTMRAAIEHTNLAAGVDTIKFKIPAEHPGAPIIQPNATGLGALPVVAHPVVIDATTQPGTNRVAIDGSLLSFGHGLRLGGDSATIKGLSIYNCDLSGIQVDGHNVTIQNCYIGVTADGQRLGNKVNGIEINQVTATKIGGSSAGEGNRIEGNKEYGILLGGGNCTVLGNVISYNGHANVPLTPSFDGILIEGNLNKIGGSGFGEGNTIIGNYGSGVAVKTGYGNSILSNSIDSNSQYGIDLYPIGIDVNDTLDSDAGSNENQNYPVIDSVSYDQAAPQLYGHLMSAPNRNYTIQFFASTDCDPLRYGEGRRFITSLPVNTDAQGLISFGPVVLPDVEESEFITATATDPDGNTSEFSRCYSLPRLVIWDDDDQPIPLTLFSLATVASDYPNLTETFLDTATTDSLGQIFLEDVGLEFGDNVKVYKRLHSQPRTRPSSYFQSKYSIRLDNMQFTPTGFPRYYRINDSAYQHIIMNHTTVGYNLVVGIEWDAEQSYLQGTQDGFRSIANYYYDVSDGQLTFDTVAIVDNHVNWNEADIWVHASNTVWPHVFGVGGVHSTSAFFPGPVNMPRQHFGTETKNRNLSESEHPLNVNDEQDVRTKAHELGHYMLSFYDEYQFVPPVFGERCESPGVSNYGYMDDDNLTSEMSSLFTYQNSDCQNTRQWYEHGKSCWDTWESELEGTYSGLFAPIITPDERDSLPPGKIYLPGPNVPDAALDYDVGSKIVFPVTPAPPATAQSRLFKAIVNTTGQPVPKATVFTDRLVQGETSDSGRIWVLGYEPGEITAVTHWAGNIVSGRYVDGGQLASGGTDTIEIELSPASGDPRLLEPLALTNNDITLSQQFSITLPGLPSAMRHGVGTSDGPYPFAGTGASSSLTLADTGAFAGYLLKSAPDAAGDTFYFVSHIAYTSVFAMNLWTDLSLPSGSAFIRRDSLYTNVTRAGIVASQFPVIRNGLDSVMEQAGLAVSFASLPSLSVSDSAGITIHYSDDDLSDSGAYGHEQSLRIFSWNQGSQSWALLGGDVDTLHNEVSAPISGNGIYAAFTTNIATGTNDPDAPLPVRFELRQNYPNPFNPVTTVEYSIPTRSHVSIDIYNILGQRVRTLVDEMKSAGSYHIDWNGKDTDGHAVATGMYLYRMKVGDTVLTKKMLLVK